MSLTPIEIERRFYPHTTSQQQENRIKGLRQIYEGLAMAVVRETPPGREQTEALTQLETSAFWAVAAIAREEVKPG